MDKNTKVIFVNDAGLKAIDSRPNFLDYIKKTHERRHFIRTHAKAGALSNGRDRYLGNLWILLDPVFQVSVYALIFGLILNIDRGMHNFIGFLTIGVTFFGFLTKGFGTGSSLIQGSKSLINSFNFPKISLGISKTYQAFINNFIPALLAVIVSLLFQLDRTPSFAILLIIPLYVLVHIFSLGSLLITARLTAFIPDLKSLISLFTRALFFLSGVFFDVSRFDTHPSLKILVEANPIYQFLMAARLLVLDGTIPSLSTWAYLCIWSFSLLIFGSIFFWQAEERYVHVR